MARKASARCQGPPRPARARNQPHQPVSSTRSLDRSRHPCHPSHGSRRPRVRRPHRPHRSRPCPRSPPCRSCLRRTAICEPTPFRTPAPTRRAFTRRALAPNASSSLAKPHTLQSVSLDITQLSPNSLSEPRASVASFYYRSGKLFVVGERAAVTSRADHPRPNANNRASMDPEGSCQRHVAANAAWPPMPRGRQCRVAANCSCRQRSEAANAMWPLTTRSRVRHGGAAYDRSCLQPELPTTGAALDRSCPRPELPTTRCR